MAHKTGEASWRDVEPLRRIADALRRSTAVDAEVAEAVHAARDEGYSWAAIAAMLGVSKQTAQALQRLVVGWGNSELTRA